ncbi:amino acid adenylation domain-containing protein [Bacillus cereus]|nr:amino acid adenylation domain-containing protein [Bacillus cereus]
MERKEDLFAKLESLSPEKKKFLMDRLKRNSSKNIMKKRRESDLPVLSFAQQRLWFFDQLEPGSSTYNMPFLLKIEGDFDINVFEKSLNEIIQRHEILRTTFLLMDEQPIQIVNPNLSIKVKYVDLQAYSKKERQKISDEQIKKVAKKPFNLEIGPLVRANIWQVEEKEYWMLLNIHHIVGDGWSVGILIQEISKVYNAFIKGNNSPLLPLTMQYADFSIWQKGWLKGSKQQEQLNYWKKQLSGNLPVLDLPRDFSRPNKATYNGDEEYITIPKGLVEKLRTLSQQGGGTLYMLLLAVYNILLYKYSKQEDIIVGTPIANRNHLEIEPLIGFFVNTLALRTRVRKDMCFRELLQEVKQTCLGAYSNQDIPFENIVAEIVPERQSNSSVLFQTVFALEKQTQNIIEMSGVKIRPEKLNINVAKFDLTLSMIEEEDKVSGTFNYNTSLFRKSTIQRISKHYLSILEQVIENPNIKLNQLSLINKEELNQIIKRKHNVINNLQIDTTLPELFEEQVKKVPNNIAVQYGDASLTYDELNKKSNQLAHYLKGQGVGPEVMVGISMERSLDLIIGIFGVLKAGGAYVPIDPNAPSARIHYMLEDSMVPIVLSHQGLSNRIHKDKVKVICLDTDWNEIEKMRTSDLIGEVQVHNLAYVIYTSGSTGKPKGVMVPHRGLTNYLNWCTQNYYKGNGGQGSLVLSSISFDLTITGMLSPLCIGETVVLFPEGLDLEELGSWVQKRKYSVIKLTPAHLELLSHQVSEEDAAFCTDTFVVGGEPLLAKHVDFWVKHAPNTVIINEYGPTEAVVGCTNYIVKPGENYSKSIPIGKPIFNTEMYVLDTSLQPVPIGVHGELYIGGVGLAKGYYKRPELTAERFINSPFDSNEEQKLYKTGDIVRYLPNGNLEYIDRIDQQVKLRGFRIELGEIETILNQYSKIREGIVLVREDIPGDKRLVGYIIGDDLTADEVEKLSNYMSEQLPDYMVPSAFVLLEKTPLTINGKVDKEALPAPDMSLIKRTEYIEPKTEIEKKLVEIWEELLGYSGISVYDNFFGIGGHSLLAVQLMSKIKKTFNVKIPLTVIFQSGTIAALAKQIDRNKIYKVNNSIVPLQPKGNKRPIFFVHPIGGHIISYFELAKYLGVKRPFYAFQSLGLESEETILTNIKEMANFYIKEMQNVQEEGPYIIGGWSFGGVVAFEMARQLVEKGIKVEAIILLDTWAPDIYNDSSEWDDLAVFMNDLMKQYNLEVSEELILGYKNLSMQDERIRYVISYLKNHSKFKQDIQVEDLEKMIQVFQTNLNAYRSYEPEKLDQDILLFTANHPHKENNHAEDDTLFWGKYVQKELKVIELNATHYSMMQSAHAEDIAYHIDIFLEEISKKLYNSSSNLN